MREYSVRILDIVFADIDDIADFIIKVSTAEHAAKYAQELGTEIMSLRYLADIIPESRYKTIKRYHPHAKQLRTRNKKLNIVFHIEGDTVIVDKILVAKMIID